MQHRQMNNHLQRIQHSNQVNLTASFLAKNINANSDNKSNPHNHIHRISSSLKILSFIIQCHLSWQSFFKIACRKDLI